MMTLQGRDLRFWLLLAAFLLAIIAFLRPHLTERQDGYDIVAVLDITGSMNVRDMQDGAESRLAAARDALIRLAGSLPCPSRLGFGIFTERRSFLLLEPVPICGNYDALTGTFSRIDWRMAWEGDSYIARGLYSAIELAASVKADVLFLTDGHEAPPLPAFGIPPFEGKRGEVLGLVVGVGAEAKAPIPKFDDEGREIGVYGPQDVPQDNRIGLPPAGAESRPGWNPRNAPFGAEIATGDEHLSSLREEHLAQLADVTGLGYVRLAGNPELIGPVRSAMTKRRINAAADIGIYPASLALALLAALYGLLPLVNALSSWRAIPSRTATMKGAFR